MAEPERTDDRREIANLTGRMGELMKASLRSDEAERLLTESLALHRDVCELEPERADLQRDLSIAFNRLGLLALDRQDYAAAGEYFEKELLIAQQLVAGDPDDASLAVELAQSLLTTGRLAEDVARIDEARQILLMLSGQERLPPVGAQLLVPLLEQSDR